MRQRGAPLHSPASACLCLGVAIAFPGPASCQQQYQTACQRDLSSSTWQVSGGRLLEQQWEIFRGGSNFVSVTKATAKREILFCGSVEASVGALRAAPATPSGDSRAPWDAQTSSTG